MMKRLKRGEQEKTRRKKRESRWISMRKKTVCGLA
jgi:hypothetical protein